MQSNMKRQTNIFRQTSQSKHKQKTHAAKHNKRKTNRYSATWQNRNIKTDTAQHGKTNEQKMIQYNMTKQTDKLKANTSKKLHNKQTDTSKQDKKQATIKTDTVRHTKQTVKQTNRYSVT